MRECTPYKRWFDILLVWHTTQLILDSSVDPSGRNLPGFHEGGCGFMLAPFAVWFDRRAFKRTFNNLEFSILVNIADLLDTFKDQPWSTNDSTTIFPSHFSHDFMSCRSLVAVDSCRNKSPSLRCFKPLRWMAWKSWGEKLFFFGLEGPIYLDVPLEVRING